MNFFICRHFQESKECKLCICVETSLAYSVFAISVSSLAWFMDLTYH